MALYQYLWLLQHEGGNFRGKCHSIHIKSSLSHYLLHQHIEIIQYLLRLLNFQSLINNMQCKGLINTDFRIELLILSRNSNGGNFKFPSPGCRLKNITPSTVISSSYLQQRLWQLLNHSLLKNTKKHKQQQ